MAKKPSSTPEARRRSSRHLADRSRIALFDVFREAFREKDARKQAASFSERGGQSTVSMVSARSKARRQGVDEETLRDHVRAHLATLMNSIRLDAIVSLDDTPEVAQSVLNYGFQDLSNLSRQEISSVQISRSIKQSLMNHEPRLVPESITVRVTTLEGDLDQRVAVMVSADLIADPADIPVEFMADVDVGAGKVSLTSKRI